MGQEGISLLVDFKYQLIGKDKKMLQKSMTKMGRRVNSHLHLWSLLLLTEESLFVGRVMSVPWKEDSN